MPRLVVVLPLDPLPLGAGWHLNDWPLHVTVAPTFVIDAELPTVVGAVEPVMRSVPAFTVTAGPDEGFGRSGAIPVSLLEPSPILAGLHRALLGAIIGIGGVFDDPEYTGNHYRPHITMTKAARVHPGDRLHLRQATLVDMEPVGAERLRHVVRSWTLV
ncbi:2'-5' RNA ligase superfamily protein [Nakamurella panacisegetis]|uniref:2'-5' RNA ligase superfamily protein n=1 Tax=Nakamurella panacisegetis TaxID=1090615 RepID=A0A1H0RYQ1_9ACTN|nr:2'-5' RNA ligase family protein [Nakamurella panacisegetis]SDP34702.1 2'-5' RNA ligase superfamily protein [Nakamurella panacisegetis]